MKVFIIRITEHGADVRYPTEEVIQQLIIDHLRKHGTGTSVPDEEDIKVMRIQ